jgi:hypothetical protein
VPIDDAEHFVAPASLSRAASVSGAKRLARSRNRRPPIMNTTSSVTVT